MRVVFLVDFQGVHTNEVRYEAGAEAEIEDAVAKEMIANGWVEEVKPPAKETKAKASS